MLREAKSILIRSQYFCLAQRLKPVSLKVKLELHSDKARPNPACTRPRSARGQRISLAKVRVVRASLRRDIRTAGDAPLGIQAGRFVIKDYRTLER
jgi:hypothetical protein